MGCISHDCKLDSVTIQGYLTGDQYIRDVLQPVVLHFDNHQLATRPVYMDDNAMPHRSRAVTTYLQSEAIFGTCEAVAYKLGNLLCKSFVSWKQHCIGSGSSYLNMTSDV